MTGNKFRGLFDEFRLMIGAVPDPLLAPMYRLDSRFRLWSYLPFDELAGLGTDALTHQLPIPAAHTSGSALAGGFMGQSWIGTLVDSRVSYPLPASAVYTQFSLSLWCYLETSINVEAHPRLASIHSPDDVFFEMFLQHLPTGWTVTVHRSLLMEPTFASDHVAVGRWFHVVLAMALDDYKLRLWVDGRSENSASLNKPVSLNANWQFFVFGNSLVNPSSFSCKQRNELRF